MPLPEGPASANLNASFKIPNYRDRKHINGFAKLTDVRGREEV